MQKTANIIEIFSSVQGEGPYVGYRQIFIRFSGCNLACDYCDTDFQPQELCNLQSIKIKNPVSVEKLLEAVSDVMKIPHQAISLTGGEPLLNTAFLLEFLPEFRDKFPETKIYLETNGTLFEELKKIIDYTDIISMDLKLKSSTGSEFLYEQHKKFIEIALNNNKEIFAKAVITDKISDEEIKEIAGLLNSFGVEVPLVLQPVTLSAPTSCSQLLKIQAKFLEKLPDTRIIPQVHRFLGLL